MASQYEDMTPDAVMESFKLQPLHIRSINSLFDDSDTAINHLRRGMNETSDVAGDLEELAQSDLRDDLEACDKNLIDFENIIKCQQDVLSMLQEAVLSNDGNAGDGTAFYDQSLRAALSDYSKKTAAEKYHKHEKYAEFKEIVWNVSHPNEPMPNLDTNEEDDDLVVSATRRSLKCPITQEWLEHPLTSKLCKHTFSSNAIKALIRRNGGTDVECPVPGCRQLLTLSVFYDDTLMERLVAQAKERGETNEDEFHDVE
ncbi:hypothetical protein DM01DRAFT_1337462 [Hesseltinella vesiculosa]|uniref:SP-RING-type domain-containing protein n=1 Tax=Hesseltinella vesiculosa TaxID=101127 RepID=A0A1X2GCR9_9FUNG|nr:hypothetical protein DM01DRAFT_1337462 [Hesseltinella vesiculosa]